MGLFTSDNASHIPHPLARPAGVFPEHTHHQGVAMRVREKWVHERRDWEWNTQRKWTRFWQLVFSFFWSLFSESSLWAETTLLSKMLYVESSGSCSFYLSLSLSDKLSAFSLLLKQATDRKLFEVSGKVFSISDKKVISGESLWVSCTNQCLESRVSTLIWLSRTTFDACPSPDANGQKLFSLHKKHLTLHHRIEGEDPHGNVLFSVKKAMISIGSRFEIEFQNKAGDGQQVTWHVKGDLFDRKATITGEDGTEVG